MKKIKCILVDDEINSLDRLEHLLLQIGEISILDKVFKPDEAIQIILKKKPDLVFVDIEMPIINGFDIVKAVQASLSPPAFVFVSDYTQYAIEAIRTEAFDYIVKPININHLKKSIQRFNVKRNRTHINENYNLSLREKEIAKLVALGKNSAKIAKMLNLSKHTINTHRRNISQKIKKHPR